MSMQPHEPGETLAKTMRVARAAFPKGSLAIRTLPVTGNRTVLGISGPLADHDLRRDELPAMAGGPGPGHSQCPARPQTGHQLPRNAPRP